MKENFVFKKTMEDIAEYSKAIELLRKMATELGLDPDKLNHHNLITRCAKILKDTVGFEAKAKELGYSSLGNALKALSMMAERPGKWDISTLPQVYHRPPMIWLQGRKENKRKDIEGSAPMAVRHAERRHRTMMPLLLEAWALIDGNPEEVEALEYNYLIGTPNEYERFLYELIYNLEPIPLEEEFEHAAIAAAKPTTKEDPDVEAMVALMVRQKETMGEEICLPLIEQAAIKLIRENKHKRR